MTAGIKKSLNGIKEKFNNKYSSTLTALGGLFNKKDKTTNVTTYANIPTEDNSKSYGDYMPEGYILRQLSFELSKFVKSIDKPTINFTVNEHNEYNRKRLVYDKMDFGDLKISFWDVKENPVERFLMAYLKIISNKTLVDISFTFSLLLFIRYSSYIILIPCVRNFFFFYIESI